MLALDTRKNPLLELLHLHLTKQLSLQLSNQKAAAKLQKHLSTTHDFEKSSLNNDLSLSLGALATQAHGDSTQALSLLSQMRFVYPYQHTTILSRVPKQLLHANLLTATRHNNKTLH